MTLSLRYRKTEAGRAEIRERRLPLTRPARNLLLIIDDTRRASQWQAMVAGVALADLEAMVEAGLLEAVDDAAAAPAPAAAAPAAAAPAATPLRLDEVPYRPLYDYLTAQARPRLGLMQGLRAVMEIERCSGPEPLRAYALHFVELVRKAQGDAAAREVAGAMASLAAP